MSTKTLLQLRTKARQRADMVNSQFVSDAELTDFINDSAKELFDLLVASNQDYNTEIHTFSISSGNTAALPSDFYKLRGVDVSINGEWKTVKKFNFLERDKYSEVRRSVYQPRVRYRVIGTDIHFLPDAQAPGSYRIWYVPEFVEMVADSDTTEIFNGWDEYIIVDAAVKMKDKEESDVGSLMKQKADLVRRITAMANTQDFGHVDTIAETETNYEIYETDHD